VGDGFGNTQVGKVDGAFDELDTSLESSSPSSFLIVAKYRVGVFVITIIGAADNDDDDDGYGIDDVVVGANDDIISSSSSDGSPSTATSTAVGDNVDV
jgi:hypothetical protein